MPSPLPTAGKVGSLFGLKPYSSISFLRSSSEFLRAFLFRQNQSPARTSKATATTGTTTATATFPPPDNPPELLWGLDVLAAKAAEVVEELDAEDDEAEVGRVGVWELTGAVEVMTMVVGSVFPSLADLVTTEVATITEDVSG